MCAYFIFFIFILCLKAFPSHISEDDVTDMTFLKHFCGISQVLQCLFLPSLHTSLLTLTSVDPEAQRSSEPCVRLHKNSLRTQTRNRLGRLLRGRDETLQVQVQRCCNSQLHNLVFWNGRAAKARKGHAVQVTPVGKRAISPQKATTSAQQQQQLQQQGRPGPSHLCFIRSS